MELVNGKQLSSGIRFLVSGDKQIANNQISHLTKALSNECFINPHNSPVCPDAIKSNNTVVKCHCLVKVRKSDSFYGKVPETKLAEFANSIDPDETAHYEPSHLNIRCLSSSL